MSKTSIALAGALATCVAATTADARELTYGHYVSSVHVMNVEGMTPYFDRVSAATGGELTFKTFWGGAMGGPKELLGAVGDNVLDSGGTVDVYMKKALPTSALLSSLFVPADDVLAFGAAMNEYQLLNCPSCTKDYERANVVPVAFYSTSPYLLMCTSKVTTLDELAGKKARATSRMGILMQTMGATPVSISSGEMYEALQRGAADCSVGSAAWLTDYNIKDFVKSIIKDPLGAYIGSLVLDVNADVWSDLSEDQRAAMINEAPQMVADIMFGYLKKDDVAIEAAIAAGATVYPAGDDFRTKLEEIRPTEWDAAIAAGEEDGIENAREIIEGFRATVDKWRAIVAEVDGDKAAYAAALEREIFSKMKP